MTIRSLLFVPGDRPERMEKALGLGADALILDWEDSVSPDARPAAREAVVALLSRAKRETKLFIRVNPLDSADYESDLKAAAEAKPDGIVFPKAEGAASIGALAKRMGSYGLLAPILPIASETPGAVFQLGSYAEVADRLCGLTWGAEDLPAAVGAATSREDDGRYTSPYEMVRALTLFAAHAAGVQAIETVYPAFHDLDGLAAYAARGRRDGFTGMMAIHPSQIAVINATFSPSDAEIAHARAVIAAFASHPGAGALQLDGRMVDAPHLKHAHNVLRTAGLAHASDKSKELEN
jgi:citrate lyase subunit beta/citryl-CoA lyase